MQYAKFTNFSLKITHYIVHVFNCYIISGFGNSLESEQPEQVIKKLSIEKEQLCDKLKGNEVKITII